MLPVAAPVNCGGTLCRMIRFRQAVVWRGTESQGGTPAQELPNVTRILMRGKMQTWLRSWLRSWLRGPVAVRCSGASRVEHASRVLFPVTRRRRFAAHVQTRRTSRSVRLPICASENAWWSGRSAHASAGERARHPAAKHTRPAGNAPGGRVPPHCRLRFGRRGRRSHGSSQLMASFPACALRFAVSWGARPVLPREAHRLPASRAVLSEPTIRGVRCPDERQGDATKTDW
jgi:hypothetical protein